MPSSIASSRMGTRTDPNRCRRREGERARARRVVRARRQPASAGPLGARAVRGRPVHRHRVRRRAPQAHREHHRVVGPLPGRAPPRHDLRQALVVVGDRHPRARRIAQRVAGARSQRRHDGRRPPRPRCRPTVATANGADVSPAGTVTVRAPSAEASANAPLWETVTATARSASGAGDAVSVKPAAAPSVTGAPPAIVTTGSGASLSATRHRGRAPGRPACSRGRPRASPSPQPSASSSASSTVATVNAADVLPAGTVTVRVPGAEANAPRPLTSATDTATARSRRPSPAKPSA